MENMKQEEDLIRDSLRLEMQVSDVINRRVFGRIERLGNQWNMMKTAASFVICVVAVLTTGLIADASTGGRVVSYLRGKADNQSYVETGNNVIKEKVLEEDAEIEKIIYVDDKVEFYHEMKDEITQYYLNMKIDAEENEEKDDFIQLSAYVKKGQTSEELYYAIRDSFLWSLTQRQVSANKKAQIIEKLRDAANNAETEAVRDALLGVADDYEYNHKILSFIFPGEWIIFEDLSDLPVGKCVVIADTVGNKAGSYIVPLWIQQDSTYLKWENMVPYSEDKLQEFVDDKTVIYDRRH